MKPETLLYAVALAAVVLACCVMVGAPAEMPQKGPPARANGAVSSRCLCSSESLDGASGQIVSSSALATKLATM